MGEAERPHLHGAATAVGAGIELMLVASAHVLPSWLGSSLWWLLFGIGFLVFLYGISPIFLAFSRWGRLSQHGKRRVMALCGLCGAGFLIFASVYFWSPTPVTLASLFQSDFKKESAAFLTRTMTVHPHDNSWKVTVTIKEFWDFETNSKFVSVFVPDNGHTFEACIGIAQHLSLETTGAENFGVIFGIGALGDSNLTKSTGLKFTGRVYIYHEGALDLQQEAYLDRLFDENGAKLELRGAAYLDHRSHAP